MRFTLVELWRSVSLLLLFVSLSTCDQPEPLCHPDLGRNLNRRNCAEAVQQFINHRNDLLGSYNSATSRRQYYFSDNPTKRVPEGERLVHLPLSFSHQGCRVTIYMPVTARVNPAQTTWSNLSNAIRYIFRKCVDPIGSIGGIVVYQGVAIAIAQYSQIAENQPGFRTPVAMSSDLTKAFDIIHHRLNE
jgi:hypothetical protein